MTDPGRAIPCPETEPHGAHLHGASQVGWLQWCAGIRRQEKEEKRDG